MLRLKACRGDGAGFVPVLWRHVSSLVDNVWACGTHAEPNTIMVRASTEVDNQTSDNKQSDQENCRRHLSVSTLRLQAVRDELLIIEKQNSASPNHRTPKMLIAHTQTVIAAVYAAA